MTPTDKADHCAVRGRGGAGEDGAMKMQSAVTVAEMSATVTADC